MSQCCVNCCQNCPQYVLPLPCNFFLNITSVAMTLFTRSQFLLKNMLIFLKYIFTMLSSQWMLGRKFFDKHMMLVLRQKSKVNFVPWRRILQVDHIITMTSCWHSYYAVNAVYIVDNSSITSCRTVSCFGLQILYMNISHLTNLCHLHLELSLIMEHCADRMFTVQPRHNGMVGFGWHSTVATCKCHYWSRAAVNSVRNINMHYACLIL